MASSRPGFAQRLETYRPSKTALGWCCVLSIIATMAVGFTWGGWVTSGTATKMADTAAEGARASLAAEVCTAQFNRNPDAAVQLAALNKLDSWDRADFIRKGGWANIPGIKDPVSGSADLCAQQLASAKL
jgi:hypothetical protein